jgi:hypothetical protein
MLADLPTACDVGCKKNSKAKRKPRTAINSDILILPGVEEDLPEL